jgi:arylsulfatase A-like enzyme
LENPGGIVNSYQNRHSPQLTLKELQNEIDAYDGAISYVDDRIAQLLAQIERLGLADNLLVIITSDQGEAFGEHGAVLHPNSVYREEIQVPLILWYPGAIPAGVRVSLPVSNAALPATILDLISSGEQNPFLTQSLTPLWKDLKTYPESPLPLAEMEHWPWMPENSLSSHGAMRSLISAEYHYIEHETLGTELYEWQKDPLESRNLSDSPESQAIIEWFKGFLELE